MRHSLHTNYQTSFRIQRNDDQTNFSVIHLVFDWLVKKKREKALKGNFRDFSFRGEWERCLETNSRIQTATCIEGGDVRSWALEYVHPDGTLGPKRFWHTHMGLRDTGKELVVSVRIAYSWNNEDISAETIPPPPTVPTFVRNLIRNFTAYSGRKDFRLIEKPLRLSEPGHGKLIRDFVSARERRYPLIVFNGDHQKHMHEADLLAKALAGKVQVVIMATNPELGEELTMAFPYNLHIGFRRMRVFFPMNDGDTNSRRHRWFDTGSADYEAQREGIVHGLLRNHNLIERDAVETPTDIHRLISKARIDKIQQTSEGASLEETHALYQDYLKEVEAARDEAKAEAADYAQQIDQLESALREAEWKNKAIAQTTGSQQLGADIRSIVARMPGSLPDVVQIAARLHADELVFTKEAYESAEEGRACELVSDAWQILYHMATTLHELKFRTVNPGEIGKQFQHRTGYEYARGEGKQTKNDAKLTRLRKVSHEGKDYEIWAHIKKGNEGTKMIRIHFDFDTDDKKIVVGFVGLHMDNASTRGRK